MTKQFSSLKKRAAALGGELKKNSPPVGRYRMPYEIKWTKNPCIIMYFDLDHVSYDLDRREDNESPPRVACHPHTLAETCGKFLAGLYSLRKETSYSELQAFVAVNYKALFRKEPSDEVHTELAAHRVAVELKYRDEGRGSASASTKKQRERASHMKLSRLGGDDRRHVELLMLERGDTTMAKKKTSKKKTSAKKSGPKDKSTLGKKSGLPIFQTWIKHLRENEKAKRTDDDLLVLIQKEYPTRETTWYAPAYVRSLYNRGYFAVRDEGTKPGTKPKLQSHAYDEDKNVIPSTAENKAVAPRGTSKKRSKKRGSKKATKKTTKKKGKKRTKRAS